MQDKKMINFYKGDCLGGQMFVLGIIVGAMLLALFTEKIGHKWDSKIIEKGCAEYNRTTGEFQWK